MGERFHPRGMGRVHAIGIYPVVHHVHKRLASVYPLMGVCDILGVQPIIRVRSSLSHWTRRAAMPSSKCNARV